MKFYRKTHFDILTKNVFYSTIDNSLIFTLRAFMKHFYTILLITISLCIPTKAMEAPVIAWEKYPDLVKLHILGLSGPAELKDLFKQIAAHKRVSREWRALLHEPAALRPLFSGRSPADFSQAESQAFEDYLVHAFSNNADKGDKQFLKGIHACLLLPVEGNPLKSTLVQSTSPSSSLKRLKFIYSFLGDTRALLRFLKTCSLIHMLCKSEQEKKELSDLHKAAVESYKAFLKSEGGTLDQNHKTALKAYELKPQKTLSYEYSMMLDNNGADYEYLRPGQEFFDILLGDAVLLPGEMEFLRAVLANDHTRVQALSASHFPPIIMLIALRLAIQYEDLACFLLEYIMQHDTVPQDLPNFSSYYFNFVLLAEKAIMCNVMPNTLLKKWLHAICVYIKRYENFKAPGGDVSSFLARFLTTAVDLIASNEDLLEEFLSDALVHNLCTEHIKNAYMGCARGTPEDVQIFLTLPASDITRICMTAMMRIACANGRLNIVERLIDSYGVDAPHIAGLILASYVPKNVSIKQYLINKTKHLKPKTDSEQ